jgi:putative iron-regulated protein
MKTMRSWMSAVALVSALCLAALPAAAKTDKRAVIDTYVRIAHAAYADSLASAKTLRTAVNAFLKAPSKAGLEAARKAWIAARVPYMQTEAYRFGNAIVDEWEG